MYYLWNFCLSILNFLLFMFFYCLAWFATILFTQGDNILTELNLSHNNFSAEGGLIIGSALGNISYLLQDYHISWFDSIWYSNLLPRSNKNTLRGFRGNTLNFKWPNFLIRPELKDENFKSILTWLVCNHNNKINSSY